MLLVLSRTLCINKHVFEARLQRCVEWGNALASDVRGVAGGHWLMSSCWGRLACSQVPVGWVGGVKVSTGLWCLCVCMRLSIGVCWRVARPGSQSTCGWSLEYALSSQAIKQWLPSTWLDCAQIDSCPLPVLPRLQLLQLLVMVMMMMMTSASSVLLFEIKIGTNYIVNCGAVANTSGDLIKSVDTRKKRSKCC